MEKGLDPALHPPHRPHERRAFRHEPTEVEGFVIGDPDFWQEAGGMKLGQDLRVDLVRLYAGMGDGLHLQGVRDHDPRHERRQQPDDGRRVPGCRQDNLVILPKALSKRRHGVVFELDPEFRRELAPIKDRDLRETSMHIHSDRPHAKSPCCRGECAGCATSTDTRSQRRRDSRRGGQITTRARSSESIRPARFFALPRPCPDTATLT